MFSQKIQNRKMAISTTSPTQNSKYDPTPDISKIDQKSRKYAYNHLGYLSLHLSKQSAVPTIDGLAVCKSGASRLHILSLARDPDTKSIRFFCLGLE